VNQTRYIKYHVLSDGRIYRTELTLKLGYVFRRNIVFGSHPTKWQIWRSLKTGKPIADCLVSRHMLEGSGFVRVSAE
jgi:hypothetical protein